MSQSANQQGEAPTASTRVQRLVRQKWRVAGIGMLVLAIGLGLAGLAAWAQLYWLAGACLMLSLGIARIIAVWNI